MFHSNHGPISYRFRDIRRFQSKISKFSHPLVFCAPLKGFSLILGTDAAIQKTRMMWLSGRQRSLRYLQSCGYNAPTWQTDRRQTDRHLATAKTALTNSVAR